MVSLYKFIYQKVCLLLLLLECSQVVYSQNPICPPGVYVADPAAHVWKDGKLYIYGSLDQNSKSFCSKTYHVMYTEDMKKWELKKNVFNSDGPNDELTYNNNILYAPDCHYKNGTYYLYYCQPDSNAEGVAVSESPIGPFTQGTKMQMYGRNEIDPGIFTDDDGTSYYVWGQISMKMAKLKSNMKEIEPSTILEDVITEKNHYFHEGAHMVKRNGIYYIIYAHMGRKNKPTCLGYAYSKKPMGPYTYGGVIIDNEGCDPANWNNHGSIVSFKNIWYVFYHRTSNNSMSMRKACVEPIEFMPDGRIKEVEMTSQGAGAPLYAFRKIEAEWACLLDGTAYVMYDSVLNLESIANISTKDKLAYKYIDFGAGADSIVVAAKLADLEGGFNIHLDQPWGQWKGYVHFPPRKATNDNWVTLKAKIQHTKGVHAVWFKFYGKATQAPYPEIDNFYFKTEK